MEAEKCRYSTLPFFALTEQLAEEKNKLFVEKRELEQVLRLYTHTHTHTARVNANARAHTHTQLR